MSSAANTTTDWKAMSVQHAFRARMESQCHEIERYRLAEMREGGRVLSMDEAAKEWIERFAADFAQEREFSSG